jgi:hypothetical protein
MSETTLEKRENEQDLLHHFGDNFRIGGSIARMAFRAQSTDADRRLERAPVTIRIRRDRGDGLGDLGVQKRKPRQGYEGRV